MSLLNVIYLVGSSFTACLVWKSFHKLLSWDNRVSQEKCILLLKVMIIEVTVKIVAYTVTPLFKLCGLIKMFLFQKWKQTCWQIWILSIKKKKRKNSKLWCDKKHGIIPSVERFEVRQFPKVNLKTTLSLWATSESKMLMWQMERCFETRAKDTRTQTAEKEPISVYISIKAVQKINVCHKRRIH